MNESKLLFALAGELKKAEAELEKAQKKRDDIVSQVRTLMSIGAASAAKKVAATKPTNPAAKVAPIVARGITIKDQVLGFMKKDGSPEYKIADVMRGTGLSRDQVKGALKPGKGLVAAKGKKSGAVVAEGDGVYTLS